MADKTRSKQEVIELIKEQIEIKQTALETANELKDEVYSTAIRISIEDLKAVLRLVRSLK